MKKKLLYFGMALVMLLALAGCGSNSSGPDVDTQAQDNGAAVQKQDSQTEAQSTETRAEAQTEEQSLETRVETQTENADATDIGDETSSSGSTLVVYSSCTGTTKGVAETIAAVTGGDLFEIVPMQAYTSDDLNYNDNNSRSTKEQNDPSVRPEISGSVENWDSFSTVYIGYPIWWGEEPRIMDTFVESYDFTGKTVIPFCTSGGSGVGKSDDNMTANAKGDGNWLEGTRLKGGVSESEISDWISGLGID